MWNLSLTNFLSRTADGRGVSPRVVSVAMLLGAASGAMGQVGAPPGATPPAPTQPAEEVPAPSRESRDEAKRKAREAAREAMPEAQRLLLDSAKALNQARSLRYNATYRVDGNLPVKLGSSEARVTMLKPEGQEYHWILRATGKGTLKDGEPMLPFDVTWFLDQTQIVDEGAKKVVVRRGRVNQPSARVAEGVKLKEMFGPQPWNAELTGTTLAMMPDEVVGGVACRVVEVAYSANRRTARVWLGAEDLLPRRFAHNVGAGNEKSQYNASIIVEFTEMELNPKVTLADVTVEAPAGYETEQIVIVERPTKEERKSVGLRPENVANPDGDAPAPVREARRPVLEAAPEFSLAATDGSTVSLADLRGSVVVLDFWGTWAIQSKQSAPEIQALHEKYKDKGVRVIGVAVKERNEEKAAATFKERGQTYTLITKGDSAASAYDVSTFPTIVVIGPAGEILNKVQKYVPGESIKLIEATIEKHLPGGGAASGG